MQIRCRRKPEKNQEWETQEPYGPSGQVRTLPGLAGPGAFHSGGVDHQHVVKGHTGVGCRVPYQVNHHRTRRRSRLLYPLWCGRYGSCRREVPTRGARARTSTTTVESVFDTSKGRLSLERHGGRRGHLPQALGAFALPDPVPQRRRVGVHQGPDMAPRPPPSNQPLQPDNRDQHPRETEDGSPFPGTFAPIPRAACYGCHSKPNQRLAMERGRRINVDVYDFLAAMRRHWVTLLACTLLGAGAALGLKLLTRPMYQAQAQLFVTAVAAANPGDLAAGGNYLRLQVKSYPQLVTSSAVLGEVISSLKLDTTPESLAKQVDVDVPVDTAWVNISVVDADPQRATDLAKAISKSFSSAVERLEARGSAGTSPIRVMIIDPSHKPAAPSNTIPSSYVILGAFTGFVLGLLLIGGLALNRARSSELRNLAPPLTAHSMSDSLRSRDTASTAVNSHDVKEGLAQRDDTAPLPGGSRAGAPTRPD